MSMQPPQPGQRLSLEQVCNLAFDAAAQGRLEEAERYYRALLPFTPDWRWMIGRADSPWYPSLRLFRQPTRGDWAGVVAEVRRALAGRPS
jgi:hypothetical protein